MKRVWLAALFLLLAAAACITEQYCIHSFYDGMSTRIKQAQEYENGDEEQLRAAIDEIKRYWYEKNDMIFTMTNHGVLDELSASVRSLNADRLDNRLYEVEARLNVFYENQKITLANIF